MIKRLESYRGKISRFQKSQIALVPGLSLLHQQRQVGVGAQRAVPSYRDGGGTARRAPRQPPGPGLDFRLSREISYRVRSPGSRNYHRPSP